MKRVPTAIVTLSVLLFMLAAASQFPVKADSNDFITFDSGVTVYSPQNTTYYNAPLVLNVSLYGAGNMGSLDPQISMSYSIDGVYNGSVHLSSDGELHVVTHALGFTNLPSIPEGSHNLTLIYYGLNQRTTQPKYLSYTDTIYFSTIGQYNAPTATPTTTNTPSPTATSTPKPTLNQLQPTPTILPTPTPTSDAPDTNVNAYSAVPIYVGALLIAAISAIGIAFLLLLRRRHMSKM